MKNTTFPLVRHIFGVSVLALAAIIAIVLGLFLGDLPRLIALAAAVLCCTAVVTWLLAGRGALARLLEPKDREAAVAAREWANKAHWYEQLLDLVQLPITVTDLDMNWTFVNAAVERLLGKSRKEIFGTPCSQWGAGICKTQNCGITRLRGGFTQTIFTQWGLDFLVDTTYLEDLEGNRIGHVEIVTDISTKVQVRGRVREAMEVIVDSSRQIEKATANLADGASTQAASLEEVAGAMDGLHEQTKLNTESATRADEIARGSMAQAKKGNDAMAKVVDAMRQINESSESVREIIRTIRDIADQTNLLALNAAIEAARAGDTGRGFAVVADEVGKLSGRSLESVKKSTEIVESILGSIAEANAMLQEAARQLGAIVTGTTSVSEISRRTAELNAQATGAIGQVKKSLEEVNSVTQQTAASSEETSATIGTLSRQIDDLAGVVESMKLDNNEAQNAKLEALLGEVKRNETLRNGKAALPA
jgi:PAS domain-containing protein